MAKQVVTPLFSDPFNQDDFIEDFQHLDVVAVWAEESGDTGAAASLATDGDSAVILTTGATDNNECYLTTTRKWDVVDNRPIRIEARLKYTEANTDDANVIVGLFSAAAADALVDDGAGPAADYSGAVFYKVDGGTNWIVESSLSTSQTTNTTKDTPGGGAYQNFVIEIRPTSSTTASVIFSHGTAGNHVTQCKDNTTGALIKHEITYTSFTAASLIIGAKAGSANSETPQVEYLRVSQVK